MSRIYTVSGIVDVTTANGNVDWLELQAADDKPLRLRGLILSQTSEVGDAQEEGLRFSILRLAATFTSGDGTGTTPIPVDDLDPAAAMTAEVFGVTVATTSGATVTLAEFGWNVRNSPYEMWWPDPEFAPMVRQASGMVVRQQTTIADTSSCLITAYVEEL